MRMVEQWNQKDGPKVSQSKGEEEDLTVVYFGVESFWAIVVRRGAALLLLYLSEIEGMMFNISLRKYGVGWKLEGVGNVKGEGERVKG